MVIMATTESSSSKRRKRGRAQTTMPPKARAHQGRLWGAASTSSTRRWAQVIRGGTRVYIYICMCVCALHSTASLDAGVSACLVHIYNVCMYVRLLTLAPAGILALPHAFQQAGLVGGALILVTGAVVETLCLFILIAAADKRKASSYQVRETCKESRRGKEQCSTLTYTQSDSRPV